MKTHLPLALMVLAAIGCAEPSSSSEVVVSLSTDLVGGFEFDQVLVTLLPLAKDTPYRQERVPVDSNLFVEPSRLVALREVDPGDYRLRLELENGRSGRTLTRQTVLASLNGRVAVSVPITRSCDNVLCDEGQMCLGGTCTEARCSFETPEFCATAATCSADSDCADYSGCARGECRLGVCWGFSKQADEPGSCEGALEWCHPTEGCITATAPPDGEGEQPEHCSDGSQNAGELGVDCGGPCAPCEGTGSSELSTTIAAHCRNGTRDAGEDAVDCGGTCEPCSERFDCQAQTAIPDHECVALMSYYEATGGTNWGLSPAWDLSPGSDPCTWTGVTCSNGSVTRLSFSALNLSADVVMRGPIPASLANLTRLQQLQLNGDFSGRFPVELTRLNALTSLVISGASGTIPVELRSLSELSILSLSGYDLFGSIPPELAALTKLERLAIYKTSISGTLPPELGVLTRLSRLQVSESFLSGTIPEEYSSLSDLRVLLLSSNLLQGSLPALSSSMRELQDFQVSNNRLTGTFPAALGDLPSLRSLQASSNQLRGALPDSFSSFTSNLLVYYNACVWTESCSVKSFLDARSPGWMASNKDPECEIPPGACR